ncbi:PQQ-like beta-propeller repeat protein [candidate division WOR-3 bacterium]|uniref:PQQ-like beta-propeller repeat protein n=1 Tax=candidate division WOR-3 bacterium TaxID=2052148 RepID=A0A937XHJ7_UNCW3|nr:PQQ-like beta-propeller repeat protein [candidate division WOR-3 bacterium]
MKSRILPPLLLIALAALLGSSCGKAPLVPDAPKGPAQWLRGITMACTTSTTDASGAQVSYQFDWGDGSKSQWSQFLDGGVAFSDTHTYSALGSFGIRVRAKNSKRASRWSAPLSATVAPGEGAVVWSIGFTDPENPEEDSADFTTSTFAIGSGNIAYIACRDYGALLACSPSGSVAWKFFAPDLYGEEFAAAPVLADDGTILIGCTNEFVYAVNPGGTAKWADSIGSQVLAPGALGADGTCYFQTADSTIIALSPEGSVLWEVFTEGGSTAPVVGVDGTVYAVNQNGTIYAIDPSTDSVKWTSTIVGKPVAAPLAIDPTRGEGVLYVVDNETGVLQSIRLADGTGGSVQYTVGADASGPVVGPDGTIYIGGDGKLTAIDPNGDPKWVFTPAMYGAVSTPALTVDGYLYILVVPGKKRLALQGSDTLYAVNPDGTRRWACGLGEGLSDPEFALSSPKLDANGYIYVGDGYRAWCIAGVSAPAESVWPMFHHDARNTGRAR